MCPAYLKTCDQCALRNSCLEPDNELCSVSVADVLAIHQEIFRRLDTMDSLMTMVAADLFEDVGNRYLDISDSIREAHLRNLDVQRLKSI
jgi:hypothetical protein